MVATNMAGVLDRDVVETCAAQCVETWHRFFPVVRLKKAPGRCLCWHQSTRKGWTDPEDAPC
jgi:hypothetical protein